MNLSRVTLWALLVVAAGNLACSGPEPAATYRCPDGFELRVERTESGEQVRVVISKDTEVTLARTTGAEGVRYTDGHVVFWIRGNEAFLEIDGNVVQDGCMLWER